MCHKIDCGFNEKSKKAMPNAIEQEGDVMCVHDQPTPYVILKCIEIDYAIILMTNLETDAISIGQKRRKIQFI